MEPNVVKCENSCICDQHCDDISCIGDTSNCSAGMISVTVLPTTGGQFELQLKSSDTVEGLRKAVAKKLKVCKDKFSILYRDGLLSQGSLDSNNIHDGARITVLPNVETGLTTQKPDIYSVMKALENLTDVQVTDFLSGKSPLTLAWRFEDHMMFVQLQLSSLPPGATAGKRRHVSISTSPTSESPSSESSSPQLLPSSSLSSSPPSPASPASDESSAEIPRLDVKALEEASRSLTKRLRGLSRTSSGHAKDGDASTSRPPKPYPGAIIDSMKAHGKGVYSGTFSGTLNPSLTDKRGRPKRSVSTVIHILNDLLGAPPRQTSETNGILLRKTQTLNCKPSKLHKVQPKRDMQLKNNCEEENKNLKGKIQQLQLMMEERKLKRQMRRRARAPYTVVSKASMNSGQVNVEPLEADGEQQSEVVTV